MLIWLTFISFLVIVQGSCSTTTTTITQTDTVVGIVTKCDLVGVPPSFLTGSGPDCDSSTFKTGSLTLTVANKRLSLTIRRDNGSTYLVDMPASTQVKLGDKWPPK